MAILNPEHLLEQAERLIQPPAAGPPRQVDVRRAISSAYYAVFHYMVSTAADEVVGVTLRQTSRYALVYRSIDHRGLRELCEVVQKPTLPPKFAPYSPSNGFGRNLPAFAAGLIDLQDKRHGADYNPAIRVKTSDALSAIRTARSAIRRFDKASASRRKAFIALLLFAPRRGS